MKTRHVGAIQYTARYTNAAFPIVVPIQTDQICFPADAYLAIAVFSGQGINPLSKHSSNWICNDYQFMHREYNAFNALYVFPDAIYLFE